MNKEMILIPRDKIKDIRDAFRTIACACYRGKNRDGEEEYSLTVTSGYSFARMMDDTAHLLNDLMDTAITPEFKEKPKPEYMERVVKLVQENPMPAVESIEINESQKKFTVKYKDSFMYADIDPKFLTPVDLLQEDKTTEKTYTFDEIKGAWINFQKHGDGPWEGNFPDFLYGYADTVKE